MATLNKDFKIKSGLIVEGTNGTINGQDILTKKQDDQDYIVSLIGGTATSQNTPDTVVKRDGDGDFAAGTITANIVGNITGDVTGTVSSLSNHSTDSLSEGQNNLYFSDFRAQEAVADVLGSGLGWGSEGAGNVIYVDTNLISTKTYAEGVASNAQTAAQGYADTVSGNAQSAAESYAEGLVQQEASDRNSAISTAITNLDLANTYDAKGAAAQALTDANDYTDTAVGNIVGAAPELLDTLQELAAALENNPDVIADLENVAAGKQDTLTPGNGIVIDNDLIYIPTSIGSGVSITPSTVEIDRAVVDTWYDASGAASSAQSAAETFATNAINALDTDDIEEGTSNLYFTNQRAIDAVGGTISDQINLLDTDDIEEGATNLYFTNARVEDAIVDPLTLGTQTNISVTYNTNTGAYDFVAENGVADSTTDDLTEGVNNLYFQNSRVYNAIEGSNIQPQSIDITWVRREEATYTSVGTASTATVHSFGTNEGSVKYLVRVYNNNKSHVTEVLATTDADNNVAVVEYGTIYTSENPLATVTVAWNASTSQYDLNVTTANNNSEVLVAATLLAYND